MIVVQPVDPPGRPHSFLGSFEIGRAGAPGPARRPALQLDDEQVSVLHCRIAPWMDGWAVTDLSAPGGTWVNGLRVSPDVPLALHKGDRLRVGGTELVVVPDPS